MAHFYKSHPRMLHEVLPEAIDRLGIRTRLDAARTVEGWAYLAGPQINRVTHSAWVRGDRLFVKLTSAAWRYELYLQRRAWRDRLNEHLGAELVREILFR